MAARSFRIKVEKAQAPNTLSNEKTDPDKRNLSLKIKLKNIFVEWCKNSTCHGVPNIFRTDYITIMIFWTFFLLGFTGLCSFTILKSLLHFLSFPVMISMNVIHENPSMFPAITLCNQNAINTKTASQFIYETLVYNNMSTDKYPQMNYSSNYTPYDFVELNQNLFKSNAFANKSLTDDDRYKMGFSLDEMLISCSYDGNPCTSQNFQRVYTYEYGNCYLFNSGRDKDPVRYVSRVGIKNGLRLEMFVGEPDIELDYSVMVGLKLFIHNQSILPLYDQEGIDVSTGQKSNIVVKRVFHSKLDKPYSDCLADSTSINSYNSRLYRATVNASNTFMEYRQAYCFELCYQSRLLANCSCTDASLESLNNSYRYCTTEVDHECASEFAKTFYKNINRECSQECPLECNKVNYLTSISTADYPSYYYAHLLQNQDWFLNKYESKSANYSRIKSTILALNIYYDELSYIYITEMPELTIETFIANIGGDLGLFIGISLLSVLEMVELLLNFLITCTNHYKSKKRVFSK